jgi:tetratricopeptide (TPR) repeat protein
VGPGGNAVGGRSSSGSVSGPYGSAAGGSRSGFASGPYGSAAGSSRYGVASGAGGTVAGGSHYGVASGAGGTVAGGSRYGYASGYGGAVAGGSRYGYASGYGGSRYGAYGAYNSGWMHGSWNNNYYGGWGLGAAALGFGLAGWGLGSSLYSNGWGYMPYVNPYYPAPMVNFPQAAGYYDYSQPIDTTSPAVPEAVADPAMTAFDQARAAFLAKDYTQALTLVDQAIKGTPNNAVAHEFRAVTLFALGKYEDAAGGLYGVLSVGPGWDWTTLISLYPDIETYTAQLRALEQFARNNPTSAASRFVLAYLYLTAGQNDAAIGELKRVVALQPSDRVSAQLLQSLTKGQPDGTGAAPVPAPAQASVPGGKIAGTWTASPGPGATITLSVADDGKFKWATASKGPAHTLAGQSTYGDSVLTLVQDEGGAPMVGRLTWKDANDFTFQALGGGAGDPGLAFKRSP